MKALEKFRPLEETVDKAASTARESDVMHFDISVRQRPVSRRGDLVYIDSLAAVKATEGARPDKDPSRKLQ